MMLIINGIPEQQEDLSWNTKHKGFLWNNEMEFAQSNVKKKKNQLGKMLERQISIKSDLTFYWSGFYC